jgi:hemoglobin-like flavoprotein
MRWFWWRREKVGAEMASAPTAPPAPPAPPTPAERHPITYVVLRVGDRWFANVCADRDEALAIQQALGDDGRYAFAGEATAVENAHWQLREALRVFWGARGPMPWTGLPQSNQREGMNVQLLRTSFEHALNNDDEIVAHFYRRLFSEHPELRAYFPRNMGGQERALGEKLAEIMLHLEDADYLQTHLAALGTRHAVQYRVKPEMYGYVKDALIRTLADAVPDWNDELEREWDGALTAVAGMMQVGAVHAA